MLEAVRANGPMGDPALELRIGINSGPVVAGVIGRKRFLYDLWGDAVNIADRMQTHGTPGRIQVTRATYELLKDEFVLEPRGTIEVRGKGDMETWYLVGPRVEAAAPPWREFPPHGTNGEEGPITWRRFPAHGNPHQVWAGFGAK